MSPTHHFFLLYFFAAGRCFFSFPSCRRQVPQIGAAAGSLHDDGASHHDCRAEGSTLRRHDTLGPIFLREFFGSSSLCHYIIISENLLDFCVCVVALYHNINLFVEKNDDHRSITDARKKVLCHHRSGTNDNPSPTLVMAWALNLLTNDGKHRQAFFAPNLLTNNDDGK